MASGWVNSGRRSRLPSDWPKRRRQVKRRAGGRCEHTDEQGRRCTTPGTDVDHVTRGDNHELANLQLLCVDHHKEKTVREAVAAQPRRKRPVVKHPGFV